MNKDEVIIRNIEKLSVVEHPLSYEEAEDVRELIKKTGDLLEESVSITNISLLKDMISTIPDENVAKYLNECFEKHGQEAL